MAPITATESGAAAGRSVLEGAFLLLESLREQEQAGLAALAGATGLPKTTAYRLLEQLAGLGAVERHGTSYRMGSRIFRLGRDWQPHPGLRLAAAGPLRRLAQSTGATAGICVLREGRTFAAQGLPGMTDELAPFRPGTVWPWTTAAGKLLVATATTDLPLGPLHSSWQREAAAIRDAATAVDREELVPGVCCVATPVLLPHGEAVGAVCAMVTPSFDLRKLTDAVTRTGRAISAGLTAAASRQRLLQ
ncbi:helix-turn-helix domain-containing protein [Streptomyces sp. XH2]|uniref:helix-turn-helix domain-containing protein n=1 Tax=Streptomyces sp. XH2 TaxID=3412483 RepID=UPI003C7B87A7